MLSNAVKYASTERPLIVSVKAWNENETIVLSFTDNGQGIDLDAHGAKIFQPFTRFNNKTEGSGIESHSGKKYDRTERWKGRG